MNNRDLIEFARFFSLGVDKSVNAYEKAQAAEIARARNKIAAQDKADNQAYRQQLLALKRADSASLNEYRKGKLEVDRARAAARGAGGGAGATLSPAAQAVLSKYGAQEPPRQQGGGITNNYINEGSDDAAAVGGSSPDVDVAPISGSDDAQSFAGGGIVQPGLSGGGIDGDTPIPQASSHASPLAAGANMFSSSFKVPRFYDSIDETGAVHRGQTRLQRWIGGMFKGESTPNTAIQTKPLAPLEGYARGGMVRRPVVDAGTSGPKSGFGFRAAPPVTQGSN